MIKIVGVALALMFAIAIYVFALIGIAHTFII